MSMVEELKRVMGAVTSVNHRSVDWQDSEHALSVASDFFRDHGQAMVEAIDRSEKYRETLVTIRDSTFRSAVTLRGYADDRISAIDIARTKDAARGEG